EKNAFNADASVASGQGSSLSWHCTYSLAPGLAWHSTQGRYASNRRSLRSTNLPRTSRGHGRMWLIADSCSFCHCPAFGRLYSTILSGSSTMTRVGQAITQTSNVYASCDQIGSLAMKRGAAAWAGAAGRLRAGG